MLSNMAVSELLKIRQFVNEELPTKFDIKKVLYTDIADKHSAHKNRIYVLYEDETGNVNNLYFDFSFNGNELCTSEILFSKRVKQVEKKDAKLYCDLTNQDTRVSGSEKLKHLQPELKILFKNKYGFSE